MALLLHTLLYAMCEDYSRQAIELYHENEKALKTATLDASGS